jgi:regulator of protease activity HflC (stomatin/prohibitin superfamily)
MKNSKRLRALLGSFVVLLSLGAVGCGTWQDVPVAHFGRRFSRRGPIDLAGGAGFTGPVLPPGTYQLGPYDQMVLVDCATDTLHDPLTVTTQDGVEFGIDIYVRFAANCEQQSVIEIMQTLSPEEGHTVTSQQLFTTYIRPALASVVREIISPHRANELNGLQQELVADIRERFTQDIEAQEGSIIHVYEVSLSNLDFPDALDSANEQRAVQTIMRDTAVAERERVQAETATAEARVLLAQRQGEAAGAEVAARIQAEGAAQAARIDAIGAALERNPAYLQYGIYEQAGASGNMVIAAPDPTILVAPQPHPPRTGATGTRSTLTGPLTTPGHH